ncbi:Peptide-O-fucosyltransferase [Zostera marina]|uniref:O-fucosyltransferase family protein n=1 Tax=Zostera marina TaxID=29655 RepID=A0A0K9NWI3_ZOSMR|nr:Peptide-O-fucosyltransferase [Zostera marina]
MEKNATVGQKKKKAVAGTKYFSNITDNSFQNYFQISPKKSGRNRLLKFRSLFLVALLILTALISFNIVTQQNPTCGLAISNLLPEKTKFFGNGGVETTRREEGAKEGFWKQPNGMGYRPCLEFSEDYRNETESVIKDRRKFVILVVNGGLNQQRNQIVDAVVIARILGAALVVPIMKVNVVWGDDSEFTDIFDFEYFKKTLADDIRVVASLPWFHVTTNHIDGSQNEFNASPEWYRRKYLRKMNRFGVLLLRSIDSRLSKDLPPDLQKLRCKAAFQALRFAAPIMELGNKLTERMRSEGPYLALHLRMERDVWVRTGCLPGLTEYYDDIIYDERKNRPDLLSGRTNMEYHQRKLAGLCPLTSVEISRLMKALGVPRNTRIYLAGGEPFGGEVAMKPLLQEFPYMYNKENISLPGELEQFADRASILAALDFIVAENSDVFMQSHGGNMGRALQGRRTFFGHKKHIVPQKRQMISYFLNETMPESEFNTIIRDLHHDLISHRAPSKDVTSHPIPDCMCNTTSTATIGSVFF